MIKARRAVLVRTAAAALMLSGAAVHSRGVFAQDEDPLSRVPEVSSEPMELPPGTTLVVNGGNHTTVNNAYIGADGADSTADGSGGDQNVATGDGGGGGEVGLVTDASGDGEYVGAGNGGYAESDASGGTFYSPLDPEGNPIPVMDSGGNAGSTINVDNVVAGDGSTLVEIYGGDTSVVMDTSFYVTGGTANADASGGDRNVASITGSTKGAGARTVTAGNGGNASASATGGYAPLGTIMGGRNRGAVIDVGTVVGGSGPGAGDTVVRIHGGTMNVTTVSTHRVATGGLSVGNAAGGSGNVAIIDGVGLSAAAGNGGNAASEANGGVATIGTVDGELFSQIGGWNRGATISLGTVSGGSGTGGGAGGDATVEIYGGDITASATSLENPAYAAMNVGANIMVQNVAAGDGSAGGQGGDATLFIDAGSIVALASGPAGADAGDNMGSRIMVSNVVGGEGVAGSGGDATVMLEGSDIVAAGTGFEVSAPESPDAAPVPGAARGSTSALAGEGGAANAAADAGSAATGKVFAGDNRGTSMMIADTVGGDGIGGSGGDATVDITATDITALFGASVNVNGGAAGAEAIGGANNAAGVVGEGGNAAAGTGGAAGANARGGNILIGDIFLGGNDGGVISVGPTTGGAGTYGTGGDATVRMDGGSILAAVILDLEARGGEANAAANGGSLNNALVDGDGTMIGALAGTGGSALANAPGGLIHIGDIEIGENSGASLKVGATTGGDGSWGGVGGDATLSIDATDIVNIVALQLQANGGKANATANGGTGNHAVLIAGGNGRAEGVTVLSGTGGSAVADAGGGRILIGKIQAGRNVGSVVKFGNITGGDAGPGEVGRSDVNHRFGGTLTVTTVAAMQANGGASNAHADGGSDNAAALATDGTTAVGTLMAGAGTSAVSEATGGTITVPRIDAGKNEGTPFQERNRGGDDAKAKAAAKAADVGKGGEASRAPKQSAEAGGKGGANAAGAGGVSDVSSKGERRGKGGKKVEVAELPETGDGSFLAAAGAGGALAGALASVGAALGALKWRRDR